jgi:pyruvate dehydrogenase E1 component alpha subunit
MAQLWQAPLVVVVEHYGIAQTTPTARTMAGSIAGRASAFGVRHVRIDTSCVPTIRARLAEPIRRTRCDAGPLVVEFRTDRLGPHSKGDDTRDPTELRRIRERDWATRYARHHPAQFGAADERQRRRVAEVTAEVLGRPLAGAARR